MARKPRHEEHENHERWLISYADFITLLFAFFVVMYSVSSVNEGKYRVLSESLVAAFRSPAKSMQPVQVGAPAKSPVRDNYSVKQAPIAVTLPNMPVPKPAPKPPLSDPNQAQGKSAGADPALATIAKDIEHAMGDLIRAGLVKVRRNPHAVEVEINTNVLFPTGSATLTPPARAVVNQLANVLRGFTHSIHVEGFTDDLPISSALFPSNWELSAGRAASVVHLFTEAGIAPERMVAMGYGQYRPVADNGTPEGRTRNRRVVLVIQATSAPETVADALSGYRPPPPDLPQRAPGGAQAPANHGDHAVGGHAPQTPPPGQMAPPPGVFAVPVLSPFAGGVIPALGRGAR